MTYLEENMKLRLRRSHRSTDSGVDAPAPQEDLFSNLDPRCKVERKPCEEGNVPNLVSMITAIFEFDLGMECAPLNFCICPLY